MPSGINTTPAKRRKYRPRPAELRAKMHMTDSLQSRNGGVWFPQRTTQKPHNNTLFSWKTNIEGHRMTNQPTNTTRKPLLFALSLVFAALLSACDKPQADKAAKPAAQAAATTAAASSASAADGMPNITTEDMGNLGGIPANLPASVVSFVEYDDLPNLDLSKLHVSSDVLVLNRHLINHDKHIPFPLWPKYFPWYCQQGVWTINHHITNCSASGEIKNHDINKNTWFNLHEKDSIDTPLLPSNILSSADKISIYLSNYEKKDYNCYSLCKKPLSTSVYEIAYENKDIDKNILKPLLNLSINKLEKTISLIDFNIDYGIILHSSGKIVYEAYFQILQPLEEGYVYAVLLPKEGKMYFLKDKKNHITHFIQNYFPELYFLNF